MNYRSCRIPGIGFASGDHARPGRRLAFSALAHAGAPVLPVSLDGAACGRRSVTRDPARTLGRLHRADRGRQNNPDRFNTRFIHTDSGRILIDGRDLQDEFSGGNAISATYRRISTCSTIRPAQRSIRRRRRGYRGRARLEGAARFAGRDFVRSMPGGLSAPPGSAASALRRRASAAGNRTRPVPGSGGAVVDEATANLDSETEAAVVDTLARLRGEKTIIVIAHRLSVLSDCDCVYLLRQGRIQTSGRLSNLFSTDAVFREFAGVLSKTFPSRRPQRPSRIPIAQALSLGQRSRSRKTSR